MEERASQASRWGDDILAGLQSGILAGTIMMAWIMLACWVQGQSAWTIPNLLAATFHGGRTYRPDFVWRTWSGLGLHFLFSGALGICFALLRPRWRHLWATALFGAVYGLLLYAVAAPRFWERVNSPLGLYSRQGFVMAGYGLFGLVLGTTDWFSPRSQALGADRAVDPAFHS